MHSTLALDSDRPDQAFHAEENGWIEGAAMLAAVAIVTLVLATNDWNE